MSSLYSYINRVFILLCSISMLLASCKKSDVIPATRTELITKAWRVNQVVINGKADQSASYSSYQITFNADGTYTYMANGTTERGTWEFSSTEQQVILNKGAANEKVLTIVNLSSNNLEYSYVTSNYKTGSMEVLFKLVNR